MFAKCGIGDLQPVCVLGQVFKLDHGYTDKNQKDAKLGFNLLF